jgi:hypothetical protein
MTSFSYCGDITTIKQIESLVEQFRCELGKRYNFLATTSLYFRGHCNSDFQLLAKFNRDFKSSSRKIEEISNTEQSLIAEFESALKIKNLYKHISTFSRCFGFAIRNHLLSAFVMLIILIIMIA